MAKIRHLAIKTKSPERLAGFYEEVFRVREYEPQAALEIGPFTIDFVAVKHIPHTYAMRVTGDACIAYSADSGPCEGLFVPQPLLRVLYLRFA